MMQPIFLVAIVFLCVLYPIATIPVIALGALVYATLYVLAAKGTAKREAALKAHNEMMETIRRSAEARDKEQMDHRAQLLAPYAQSKNLALLEAELDRILKKEKLGAQDAFAGTTVLHAHAKVASMSPTQFEAYCADILRQNGWTTRLTATTGDQGVDIIAEKGGRRLALQCKKYSSPVGNGAVQEIVAGKAFVGAHSAAVVTNNTYTPSARALAKANGVALLHYSDLARL